MRKIFTKETLKRSITPILIVLMACAFVFFWGRYRKVTVDLTFQPELEMKEDAPQNLDVQLIDGDGDLAATVFQQISSGQAPRQNVDLRPGTYRIRGKMTMKSAEIQIIEHDFFVPDNNAAITVYIRD